MKEVTFTLKLQCILKPFSEDTSLLKNTRYHCQLTFQNSLQLGSLYRKYSTFRHLKTLPANTTQPSSLMKASFPLKEYQLSYATCKEWLPEGNQQRWEMMAGSYTDESAGDKQSVANALSACCKKCIVSKKDQDHLVNHGRVQLRLRF